MKPGAGKRKGGAFEIVVAKSLSLWVTDGKRNDLFWRSSLSGGRATNAFKKGDNKAHIAGDICAVDPMGDDLVQVFFVECKHYKKLDLQTAVTTNGGQLIKFWHEAVSKSNQHGKLPMIVVKQNALPVLMGLCDKGNRLITDFFGHDSFPPLASFPAANLTLWNFQHFLEKVPYELPASFRPAPDNQSQRRVQVGTPAVAGKTRSRPTLNTRRPDRSKR